MASPPLYTELEPRTIRVLDVLPGSFEDPIETRLETVSLNNPGPYKALSYVWGSNTQDVKTINCNGREVNITTSLFVALRKFRHAADVMRLWADALCINQLSETERSHQVRSMTDIYAKAESVLIWIAEECKRGDPELLFRIAEKRFQYHHLTQPLNENEGDTPVVLASRDIKLMEDILTVQQEYEPLDQPDAVKMLIRADEKKFVKTIYIGRKRLDRYIPFSGGFYFGSVLVLIVNIEPTSLAKAMDTKYPTFIQFLNEALKPTEWTLTDGEIAKALDTLTDLGNKTYFHRAWIVQEILMACAATMHWGDHKVEFGAFCQTYAAANTFQKGVKSFVRDDWGSFFHSLDKYDRLTKIREKLGPVNDTSWSIITTICDDRISLMYQAYAHNTLSHLLTSYSGQQASEPRDIFFSLFGLVRARSNDAKERLWCESLMDYSTSYRSLVLQTATYLAESWAGKNIRSTHILDFFRSDGIRKDRTLPSWVPEWPIPDLRDPLLGSPISTLDRLILPSSIKVQKESMFIKVRIVGVVRYVSELVNMSDAHGMVAEIDIFQKCFRSAKKNPYKTEQGRSRAFWLTAVMAEGWNFLGQSTSGPNSSTNPVSDWVSSSRLKCAQAVDLWETYIDYRPCVTFALAFYTALYAKRGLDEAFFWYRMSAGMWIMQNYGLEAIPPVEILDGLLAGELLLRQEWRSSLDQHSLRKKTLIRTDDGYLGLAHPGAKAGDVVVFVPGCSDLWCLQPHKTWYTLRVRCRLHGISNHVDGIVLDWTDAGMTEIELR